jgi:hypothetical protein
VEEENESFKGSNYDTPVRLVSEESKYWAYGFRSKEVAGALIFFIAFRGSTNYGNFIGICSLKKKAKWVRADSP